MILDAAILLLACTLLIGGCWLLWNATSEALQEWRRGE